MTGGQGVVCLPVRGGAHRQSAAGRLLCKGGRPHLPVPCRRRSPPGLPIMSGPSPVTAGTTRSGLPSPKLGYAVTHRPHLGSGARRKLDPGCSRHRPGSARLCRFQLRGPASRHTERRELGPASRPTWIGSGSLRPPPCLVHPRRAKVAPVLAGVTDGRGGRFQGSDSREFCTAGGDEDHRCRADAHRTGHHRNRDALRSAADPATTASCMQASFPPRSIPPAAMPPIPSSTTRPSILTIEFKINLLSPGRGERFLFRGEVTKPGSTIIVADGRAYALSDGARQADRLDDRHDDGDPWPGRHCRMNTPLKEIAGHRILFLMAVDAEYGPASACPDRASADRGRPPSRPELATARVLESLKAQAKLPRSRGLPGIGGLRHP